MPTNRKNKAKGQGGGKAGYNAHWFTKNVKRQRRRNELAKISRKANR